MDLALALVLLWGLLFMPLGVVVHWLVLGEGARVRALPVAPVTGVAVAFLVLGALGRLDIDAGDRGVAWAFVALSVVCAIVIWRCEVVWRTRELIGAGLLLLLAVLLVQLPVVGGNLEGPLGYGTTTNPVTEVAAIDAAAHGPAAELQVARQAREEEDRRPIGFEQFAALTVAIGLDETPDDADAKAASWTAYGLHSAITGMLAALIALPLFAFARARGVRWLGLVVLVPLGVLAPAVFLALANGAGAAVASVPFTTAAVFSLLVTRRDRGWWALVVLFGAAISATAGPMALLPLIMIGVAWMFVRSNTYEHLSQHDTPVASPRTLVATGLAAGLGIVASFSVLRTGELLAWAPLHTRLWDAVRSWPFGWLDTDLSAAGPDGPLETAIWLVGPALLIVAVIYAIVRNERRELGVLVGAILAAVVTTGIGLADREAGIRLLEFSLLSTSPFLAALAVRAVSLARENGEEQRGKGRARWGGLGPTLLVVAFVVLSFAATSVTGSRMVHAPAVNIVSGVESDGTALIAAGDPWLEFIVDGERVKGGYADADALSEGGSNLSERRTRTEGYDSLVLSSSPLSSDPSLRYRESSRLDRYQVRLFLDQESTPVERDLEVDEAFLLQRARTQTADRPGAERQDGQNADGLDPEGAAAGVEDGADGPGGGDAAAAGSDRGTEVDAGDVVTAPISLPIATRHDPVEGTNRNTPPDRPAGRLLPATSIGSCGLQRNIVDRTSCEPQDPVRGEGCADGDVEAARSPIDRDRSPKTPAADSALAQVLSIEPDSGLPVKPTMLGVQCFDVELASSSTVLLVHLRDVGLIIPPDEAVATGPSPKAWETSGDDDGDISAGGVRRTTSELGATLSYGGGRLTDSYDLVLEGEFGAGVDVSSTLELANATSEQAEEIPATPIGTIRGSADGFSEILRNRPLSGVVNVTNDAGTDIELGRLFARPRDMPPSCDMPVALAEGEQRELRLESPNAAGGPPVNRPGITVTVTDVTSDEGGGRTARVVVGSYLSKAGLPRHVLVDWTEQFPDEVRVEACDGTTYVEAGAGFPEEAEEIGVEDLAEAIGGPVENADTGVVTRP